MKNLVIVIFSAGPNAIKENIEATLSSIESNICQDDYQYYIIASKESVKQIYEERLDSKKIYKIVVNNASFYQQFNYFLDECKDKFQCFLMSHEDITISTKNFLSKAFEILDRSEQIGFITFTNNGYTNQGKRISNSVRCGFHLDRFNYPANFECFSKNQLYYPKDPVIVFGPYSHFNLISFAAMQQIGYCESWSHNSLMIDEDWCLRSNFLGFLNIWISDVFYQHPNNEKLRTVNSVAHGSSVNEKFRRKWNLQNAEYSDNDIENLISKCPQLEMFRGNSYDYNYF